MARLALLGGISWMGGGRTVTLTDGTRDRANVLRIGLSLSVDVTLWRP